jgi:hypothetical protein
MSSNRTRATKAGNSSAGNSSRVETERLIEKGRFKDAVKQAKLCYKGENTPENHRLLELAYFLRARQLVQIGMRSSAIEVAQHLLETGVSTNDWTGEFIVLLISLGLDKQAFELQGRLGAPEMKDHLIAMSADRAVIQSDLSDKTSGELSGQAKLIRQALERLQGNDEAGALLVLRDLARGSVLSEWKFFVRGLAAFYRRQPLETTANWERLDPKRKAFAIAARLRAISESDGPNIGRQSTEALEKLAFGEPVLDRLRQLPGLVASQEWDKVMGLLGPLRHSLRQIDPRLAGRLTGALIGPVVKAAEELDLTGARGLVNNFTRLAEPLAIDPKWNRLWAILWSGPRGDTSESLAYWAKYIDDLKTVPVLNSSERGLAQAMVWNHMAKLYRDQVADLSDPTGPFGLPDLFKTRPGADSREIKRARKQVGDCLERSLKIAPDHLPTYELLVEVYRSWDDRANLEAAARRLLAKFPQNLETLTLLATQYIEKNDPAAALPLVQKARALKPLDESLRELEWTIRIGVARMQALAKNWDAGRDEFEAAQALLPDCRNRYDYLARRVIFEAKASQPDLSDRYLAQATASLKDPAPLWLALLIESIRYGMTKASQSGYAQLWESALKKKCVSETAGEMASLMGGYLSAGIEYPGRAGHIKKIVTYLRRTTRLKYRCVDIERVCEFLGHAPESGALIGNLVKLGITQHPRSVLLNFRAGLLETAIDPFNIGSAKAREYLEAARKMAESSTEPQETALLPQIKSALTLLNEISSGRSGFSPFGDSLPGFPFADPDFFNFFDDDDDGDDDHDNVPSTPPRPRGPGKAKTRKTPKKQ